MTPPEPGSNACPWCGSHPLVTVYVHGHGQCAACRTNLDPCCSGERECDLSAPVDSTGDES